MGKAFKIFRRGTASEKFRDGLDLQNKVGLGLPIVTPRGSDDVEVFQKTKRGKHESVDRRASPLWLQMVRTSPTELSVVATLMQAQFAEHGSHFTVKWDGSKRASVDEPYAFIAPFIEQDKTFGPVRLLQGEEM
jgi:hypothetical protein